jgi:hypothetical protein
MRCLVAVLAVATIARADFSVDRFPDSPRILPELIAAAERYGDPFAPGLRRDDDREFAYYLRDASYVGSCKAPFDRVHLASFLFVRSGYRSSPTPPASGQSFLVFFDGSRRVRGFWRIDEYLDAGRLHFEGTALLLDDGRVFDYAHLPDSRTVLLDGKPQTVPTW